MDICNECESHIVHHMKYKDCPSCGAKPEQLKAPGVRYSHTKECSVGRVETLQCPGALGARCGYHCAKCHTEFTLKNYDNSGDSHTMECPICWAIEEANNKK